MTRQICSPDVEILGPTHISIHGRTYHAAAVESVGTVRLSGNWLTDGQETASTPSVSGWVADEGGSSMPPSYGVRYEGKAWTPTPAEVAAFWASKMTGESVVVWSHPFSQDTTAAETVNPQGVIEMSYTPLVANRPGRPTKLVDRQSLLVYMSADTRNRIRAEAVKTGESESEIARIAIDAELDRRSV